MGGGGRTSFGGSTTDPVFPRHKSYLPRVQQAASFVPTSYLNEESGSKGLFSDYASEGEITNSFTVSSLITKLDSVKVHDYVYRTYFTPSNSCRQDFLKEAESMRAKFEDKKYEVCGNVNAT